MMLSDNQVKSFVDLKVNKYSGPDENLSPDDNEALVSNYTYYANPIRMPYQNGYYAEVEVSGFSEFYLSGSEMFSEDSPLPLAEAGFQAVARSNHALIQWKSTESFGQGWFQLYRSVDGQQFDLVTRSSSEAAAKGMVVSDPRRGQKMLYRLVFESENGSQRTVGQAWVQWEKRDRLELFPNPASRNVEVRFEEKPVGTPVFRLTNVLGKVWSLPFVQRTSESEFQMALPEVSPGLYQLEIRTETGSQVQKLWIR
jgi:hypothetical protein